MSHWLNGRRVVVTRPGDQAEGLCSRLRALGAEPLEFPVIAIAPPETDGPLDQAIARLNSYDWMIFTSANGVEFFWARLEALAARSQPPIARFPQAKVAAIGPATAAALHQRGVQVRLIPAEYRAEAILDEIGDVAGQHVLLPRADIARPALAEGLRRKGAQVDEVAAYRTIPATPTPAAFDALRAGVDVITFTSSSTVRNFVTQTAGINYGDPLIACIGPVTATTARELGLRVDVVAKEYTIEGLLDALKEFG
jgi:uroporphyrinogen-III synthase